MARISFHGRLQDTTGAREVQLDLPQSVSSTDTLRTMLNATYGAGAPFHDQSIRIAINNEFAHEPARINNSDDIAFMPPVGGG